MAEKLSAWRKGWRGGSIGRSVWCKGVKAESGPVEAPEVQTGKWVPITGGSGRSLRVAHTLHVIILEALNVETVPLGLGQGVLVMAPTPGRVRMSPAPDFGVFFSLRIF